MQIAWTKYASHFRDPFRLGYSWTNIQRNTFHELIPILTHGLSFKFGQNQIAYSILHVYDNVSPAVNKPFLLKEQHK